MFRNFLIASACFFITFSSQAVAEELLECKFKADKSRNWIDERSLLLIDGGKAYIFNGATSYYTKGALPVSIRKDRGGKTNYSWSIRSKTNTNQSFHVEFDIAVDHSSKMKAWANAKIWATRMVKIGARGNCEKIKPVSTKRFLEWAKKVSKENEKES